MNVIALISCKVGTGKTTLTAELAAYACGHRRRCLVIDADPHRGLALLNSRRAQGALPLSTARDLERQLEVGEILGYDWVLIDTASAISEMVEEAVRLATMVIIPARPGLLDLVDVSRTVDLVHGCGTPYAVVLNGVPMQCDGTDAPALAESRAWLERCGIPVWSGQISERPGDVLAEGEADTRSLSAIEIAGLWSMIDRSVAAVSAMRAGAGEEKRAA
jgi:chromosome partitioning protein